MPEFTTERAIVGIALIIFVITIGIAAGLGALLLNSNGRSNRFVEWLFERRRKRLQRLWERENPR